MEEVSKELANLTESAEHLTSDGVDSAAEVLQNITALNSTEPEVSEMYKLWKSFISMLVINIRILW